MGLDSTLMAAISRLRSNDLENEEEVKLAVILPTLLALDWNPAHFESIKPEYSVGQGRVDYALLCHGRPQVFIEAKRRRALDVRAEGQLFGYASNQGVPLLVLTDGYYWDFYLSMAAGIPEERRFHRLELSREDKIPEYMEFLETYLRKHRVASGEARRSAETHLEKNRERARVRAAIPVAWNSLLSEPDELLRDLLAERVQNTSGSKPDPDDVDEFLRSLSSAPERSKRRILSTRQELPNRYGETKTYEGISEAGDRRGVAGDRPLQSSQNETQVGERLQIIVQEFMLAILETYPNTLDAKTIKHLEVTKNPLGLRISNHTLLRKVSEGREVGRHTRYYKRVYSNQWYVCSEWWKKDHHHNARILAKWVNDLVSEAAIFETRDCLTGIRKRLNAYVEGNYR